MIFKSPEETWQKIRQPYETTFRDLVFGTLPSEGDLIITLKSIALGLKKVEWELKNV